MSNENVAQDIILDCKGLACPQPVVLTKKAIDKKTEALTIIVDNAAAKENVAKFAAGSGYGVVIEKTEDCYHLRLLLRPIDKGDPVGKTEEPVFAPTRPVFLLSRNTLGAGSDELGAILMKSMFISLLEAKPLPKAIMMLNSGVYLALDDSPVLAAMQELSNHGVSVVVCGTCLDYFGVKERMAVGSVSNMYSILSELNKSSVHAITL
jgi:selenium metabolism protein YedF